MSNLASLSSDPTPSHNTALLSSTDKVFMGITESRKSFSQSRQCSTDLNESFGFHLKLLVSL